MNKNYTFSASIPSHITKIIGLIITTGTFFLMVACSGGSNSMTGPAPGPAPGPSPDREVSYSKDIQPIFNGNCGGSGCHIPGPENGVTFKDYNSAVNSVGLQYGKKVIQPNDPSGSPIIDKISNGNPKFGVRMPKDRSPLSSAEIDSIRSWIQKGAKNN